MAELVYVHDPMCSWCYGFRRTFGELREQLPDTLPVRRLLGGLAPDSAQAMPAAMRTKLEATWHDIERRIPGTTFNFDFWTHCTPRRSTYPACRAVIAVRLIDAGQEEAMIGAIQDAYYRDARNPSDDETLVDLANGLGLPHERFAGLLNATTTQATLEQEIADARSLGADSFPSLRLLAGQTSWPINVDYNDTRPMRAQIDARLSADNGR